MPSLSSSPWMRGAPQSGLATFMSRINPTDLQRDALSPRRAAWISDARMIETQPGANEPLGLGPDVPSVLGMSAGYPLKTVATGEVAAEADLSSAGGCALGAAAVRPQMRHHVGGLA